MKLVLIVEDEYGNAEIMQLLLEAEGYRVALASNGQQALDLLRDGEKPALILSDFMMPVMNGAEFGRAVSQNESLSQIPFVFMSATSEDLVRAGYDGYDAFLVKPIELDTLLKVIQRLIAHGRSARHPGAQVQETMRQLMDVVRAPARD